MVGPSNYYATYKRVLSLLRQGDYSEFELRLLIIGAYAVKYRKFVIAGVAVAVLLFAWWGIGRDPILLVAALAMGFITGLIAWLLR
jgi:hypothetical protein